jgi:4-hydroxy-tetrahydrodipicolinate synthase
LAVGLFTEEFCEMSEIQGIVPPMVTPFTSDGGVNLDAIQPDVRYLLNVGVHGLAVCGSTGEGHTLTTEETRAITEVTVEAVGGRVPVITGIITDSTAGSVERGKAVADLGVAALQVTPVHYLFRPTDDALVAHFRTLTEETGLPVMIYNVVPWTYLSPDLLDRIMTEVDGVIGVKQSAGDMKLLADLLVSSERKGRIMTAVDALLYPSFALGAHGAIAAVLTAAPVLCVEVWDAVVAGDHAKAKAGHEKLLGIWNAINQDNLPANVKCAMRLQGRDGGEPRPPMPASSPEQEAQVSAALTAAGLL